MLDFIKIIEKYTNISCTTYKKEFLQLLSISPNELW